MGGMEPRKSMEPGHSNRWSLERFLQTLCYFDAFPPLNMVRRWLGSSDNRSIDPSVVMSTPSTTQSVLVVSIGQWLDQAIVRQLTDAGYRVRSLTVQGPQDSELERLEAVLTDPAQAVILCANPSHDAGIALLEPILATLRRSPLYSHTLLFDFTQLDAALTTLWGSLDDVVMGGVSESNLKLSETVAMFGGQVSTENSGGFASVRTRNLEPPLDLHEFEGLEVRVKGDGQRYKFLVRCENRWDGLAYSTSFDTERDRWITVRMPFAEMIPVFRAKTVREAGDLNRDKITSLQLMLSKFEYDGSLNPYFQPGSFSLQVASISAYKPQSPLVILVGNGDEPGTQQGMEYIVVSPDNLLAVLDRSIATLNTAS